MQAQVCTLVGKKAKFKGKKKKWWRNQTLYWSGIPIKRDSKEYQELLDKAFDALSENKSFQRALLATNNATLTHSIGKNKITETVLTRQEFCQRLTKIRNYRDIPEPHIPHKMPVVTFTSDNYTHKWCPACESTFYQDFLGNFCLNCGQELKG